MGMYGDYNLIEILWMICTAGHRFLTIITKKVENTLLARTNVSGDDGKMVTWQ